MMYLTAVKAFLLATYPSRDFLDAVKSVDCRKAKVVPYPARTAGRSSLDNSNPKVRFQTHP